MERKPFLLRLDPETMAALRAWAADDLRSLNGQIEFLLRRTLREAERLPPPRGERRKDAAAPLDDDEPGAAGQVIDDGGAAVAAAKMRNGRGDQVG